MKSFLTLVAFFSFMITASAQVEKFTIDGQTYYGTKKIPDEFKGEYLYERKGDPIVDVQTGEMAGKYQVHGVPAYPASFWVQTDEKGVIQKVKSEVNDNYQIILIVLCGDNGETGWKGDRKGTYSRIQAAVAFDQGYAVILGERFKTL